MGKNNKKKPQVPSEQHLILPVHASAVGLSVAESSSAPSIPIVDTHTHVLSTFSTYRTKYPDGQYNTISEFVKALYYEPSVLNGGVHPVEAIVDVWCEAPELREWRTLADSALTEESREGEWSGIQYHFVMGEFLMDSDRSQPTDPPHQACTRELAHSYFSMGTPVDTSYQATMPKTTQTKWKKKCI